MNKKYFAGMFCVATLYLSIGFAPAGWAFQDMFCSGSEKTDRTVCSTAPEDSMGIIKITCRTAQPPGTISPTYSCSKAARDWGQSSSPYAHTSTVWRCVSGSKEIFLFAADFAADSLRCDMVCGQCKTGWRMQP